MKKQIVLAVIIGILLFFSFAAAEENNGELIRITDETSLVSFLATGGNGQLENDITATGNLTVPQEKAAVLELNGKTLQMDEYSITTAGALTIQNTLAEGGQVLFGSGGGYFRMPVPETGILTLASGDITAESGVCICLDGGVFHMTGGSIWAQWGTSIYFKEKNSEASMSGGSLRSMFSAVDVEDGSFTLSGGTIFNSQASATLRKNAVLILSGKPEFTNNEYDLFVAGATAEIRLAGPLDPGFSTRVNVSDALIPMVLTSGLDGNGTLSNFVCQKQSEELVITDDGELEILRKNAADFNANGGKGEMAKQYISGVTPSALSQNSFKRKGWHFTGWNTQANGSGTPYTDEQEITLAEDTMFYAQWEENKVSFSVDVIDQTSGRHGKGGLVYVTAICETDDTQETIEYGECFGQTNYGSISGELTVSLEAVPAENYEFAGWYSAERLDEAAQTLRPLELLAADPAYSFALSEHMQWMPVCAVFCFVPPPFGEPAFILPKDADRVNESTFEGTKPAIVWVPDTYTSIGKYAFKDCVFMRQIRLPKECEIDDEAFIGCLTDPAQLTYEQDLCDLLMIYAPAGGKTEEWAETHGFIFSAMETE